MHHTRIPTQAYYTIMIQQRQSKTTHMSSTKRPKDFQIIKWLQHMCNTWSKFFMKLNINWYLQK